MLSNTILMEGFQPIDRSSPHQYPLTNRDQPSHVPTLSKENTFISRGRHFQNFQRCLLGFIGFIFIPCLIKGIERHDESLFFYAGL